MKYLLTIAFVLCLKAYTYGQELIDAQQQEVVFQYVNVIPMDREQVLENQTVVTKGGKITAVTDAKKAKYSKNAIVVNAKGKYLIPGLAEMHAHVPPIDNIEPMQEVLMLFVARGITTIRGMLGHPKHLELRSKVRKGEILGPHFYTTGPSFSGQTVKTAEQAIEMVRKEKQAGYDYLKLHPGLSLENFNAIAKTAKEVNIPFVGHVSFDVGIWRAIEAGYSSIDHLDGFIEGIVPGIETMNTEQTGLFAMFIADKVDTTLIPKLMNGLKSKRIWVVPTQALAERWFSPADPQQLASEPEMMYMAADVRNNWLTSKKNIQANPQYNAARINNFIALRRKLIDKCQENGVGLLLGSDSPQVFNVPGYATHHELKYMVDAGLSPYEALRTGTVNVANYLNKSGNSGTIKVGNVSDLVLLNGNPLEDITQTNNIEGVMMGNKWLSKTYIEASLKKIVKQ